MRSRRHRGPDRWHLVEALHGVVLDNVPLRDKGLAAEIANELQTLQARVEQGLGPPRRLVCDFCGEDGEELEYQVYVCWRCRQTWRQ